MSKIQVNDIVNHYDTGAPQFPKGIAVGGGATIGLKVGTGASVYSPFDNVLTLGTNTTERLRITSDGKIGVGTNHSAPTARLSIKASSAGEYVQDFLGSSTKQWGFWFNQNNWLQSTFRIDEFNSSGDATPRFTIYNGGNVGIGTDIPQYPLVVGSGTDDALSVDTLSANNGVVLRSFDAGKTDYKPLGLAAQYINFYTRSAQSSSSERMRINSSLPTLQVGKHGAANTSGITANTNLIADFGRANTNGDIASISVGTGTYRIFSGKVPAIFNEAQTTLTATFQFASSYGVAVIEMDTVGGLAQVSVGRYLMIVDCDTSNGQTAQLTGGSSIQTILASGYGSPTFTASGASATPTFTVSWTRSGGVSSENWSNYWQFFARISNNSPASPCVLTSLTMS